MRGARRRVRAPGGFTLVELVAVIALVAALSALAIPAIGAVTRARQAAAAGEAARLVTLARQRAMATGEPTGFSVSIEKQSLALIHVVDDRAAPTPLTDPSHGGVSMLDLSATESAAAIETFRHGEGGVGNGSLWFLPNGAPATRAQDGAFTAIANDAQLMMSGGFSVTIRRSTGAIER